MKKVLFVTYDFPYPTNTGGKTRAYNMLKYSGQNIKKYLFSFVRDDYKLFYQEEMKKIGAEVVGTVKRRKLTDIRNIFGFLKNQSIFKSLYYSKNTLNQITSLIWDLKIDVVQFESYYTAFFINEEFKKAGVKQIFGTENIEYEIYQDYAKKAFLPLRSLYDFQAEKIKKEEEELFKKADICLAVSASDAQKIKKYNECEVVRNGVDLEEFQFASPKGKSGKRLLFVGNFSYFPNVDAINYFYDEIFHNLSSDITLTIVGKKASRLKLVNDSRIVVKEYVEKIQDEYKKADIMISPLRLGGGTNFKILEAMACGLPVVSLPERVEGLDVANNVNILIAKNAKEFKEEIERLLGDSKLREKIAKNARSLIEAEYSWRVIGNNLNTIWNNL